MLVSEWLELTQLSSLFHTVLVDKYHFREVDDLLFWIKDMRGGGDDDEFARVIPNPVHRALLEEALGLQLQCGDDIVSDLLIRMRLKDKIVAEQARKNGLQARGATMPASASAFTAPPPARGSPFPTPFSESPKSDFTSPSLAKGAADRNGVAGDVQKQPTLAAAVTRTNGDAEVPCQPQSQASQWLSARGFDAAVVRALADYGELEDLVDLAKDEGEMRKLFSAVAVGGASGVAFVEDVIDKLRRDVAMLYPPSVGAYVEDEHEFLTGSLSSLQNDNTTLRSSEGHCDPTRQGIAESFTFAAQEPLANHSTDAPLSPAGRWLKQYGFGDSVLQAFAAQEVDDLETLNFDELVEVLGDEDMATNIWALLKNDCDF